ncbi:hypothetical protein NC797_11590 [Aquibacillus sp. 3ASR75-11]|uniref:Uncharacterized protein n=1 Tax=Terrihalobacillus insolitus TaxID=2950438 RepID=A0A9X3WV54_9BACI|nr:hypothetical protein [Terrihalobacillus insolitus]MDC3425148.1 hypothetical protein [Terrihalobacillus insolitus]
MTFFQIFSETGGMGIGVMLAILFWSLFFGTSFYMVKKYASAIPTTVLYVGIAVYLIVSVVLSDMLLYAFLFSEGEYVNYGFGEGLLRLLTSIFVGLTIGFLVAKLAYFKLVRKFLLN